MACATFLNRLLMMQFARTFANDAHFESILHRVHSSFLFSGVVVDL